MNPPVLQAAPIEVVGGEHADLRMHAVLHAQHLHGAAAPLQPLKQRALQLQRLAPLRLHCGRKLLRVPNQHGPEQTTGGVVSVSSECTGPPEQETGWCFPR